MREARLHVPGKTNFHHCIDRLNTSLRRFSKPEIEIVKSQIFSSAEYCGLELIAFSVCSCRFDVLVKLPTSPIRLSDEELFRRLQLFQSRAKLAELRQFRDKKGADSPEWLQVKNRFLAQMGDLSKFAQRISKQISMAINKRRGRNGKLWQDRLITIPVENGADALLRAAAYIDSRPVADNLCRDPSRNAFNGLALASAGNESWRTTYRNLLGKTTWKQVTRNYRPTVTEASEIPISDHGPEAWGGLEKEALRDIRKKQKLRGSGTTEKDREQRFSERLDELAAFKERFGHCDVPLNWPENPSLGIWVRRQREAARQGRLSEERRQALNELGFNWCLRRPKSRQSQKRGDISDTVSARWWQNFLKLKTFYESYGHTQVPYRYDKQLYQWIRRQRMYRQKGQCTKREIGLLDSIGFVWRPEKGRKKRSSRDASADAKTANRTETSQQYPASEKESTQKRCSRCGTMKPLEAFNRNTEAADGRRSACRECQKQTQRQYYRKKAREVCTVAGCNKPRRRGLYCSRHAAQYQNYGRIMARTVYDLNEIIVQGNYARLLLRNRSQEVVSEAIIDTEDVDRIAQYPWTHASPNGVWCGQLQMTLGRFLMAPSGNQYVVHVNNDVLDFRKSNLRLGTKQQSSIHRKLNKNNTSGVRGVSWSKASRKWLVRLKRDGKIYDAGLFKDFDEAVAAKRELEQRVWGDLIFDEITGGKDNTNR